MKIIKTYYVNLFLLFFFAYSVTVSAELVFLKQNSSPKYFSTDENKEGICELIYSEIAKRLAKQAIDTRIDPTLYPVKRILAMIKSGEAHVFCGAGRNKKREGLYYYSKQPVYEPSNVLVMHQDDKYVVKNYAELQSKKAVIGAFYGASSTTYLKTFEGLHVVDHFTELQNGLTAVANKIIPYFYYHDLGLTYLVNESELPIKLMPTKFRTYQHWLLYSKTLSEKQVEQLDAVLGSMIDDGSIQAVQAKYFND